MVKYPAAYTVEELHDMVDSNGSCPSLAMDEIERIVQLAEQRAGVRGEDSALEADKRECLIGTDWNGFAADEFGHDNGDVNQFAMALLEADTSKGKNATLFSNTAVIQNGWLTSGDGRRSKTRQYEDDDYDGSSIGELWIPNGAEEYIAIIELDPELYHGEWKMEDAM